MTRHLIAGTLGALVILAGAALFLWAVPVQACEWTRASWYGSESGNRTATGEHFDGSGLTAAMPSRKYLGHRYRVTYGNRSVVVRINDVGPAKWTKRGIDLSKAAARKIGLIPAGVARVKVCRVR